MIYLGNDKYQIFTDTKSIELSVDDIKSIIQSYIIDLYKRNELVDFFDDYTDFLESIQNPKMYSKYKSNKRKYHKKILILELFNKYHDDKKTKKEVFIQIAKELNISFKAVEKAFYTKH